MLAKKMLLHANIFFCKMQNHFLTVGAFKKEWYVCNFLYLMLDYHGELSKSNSICMFLKRRSYFCIHCGVIYNNKRVKKYSICVCECHQVGFMKQWLLTFLHNTMKNK